MNRRFVLSALFAAASIVAAGAAPNAQAAAVHAPVHAMFSKTKMVKLSLRNDSGAAIKIKAGDTSMTLDAGKTMPVKLAEGTSIVMEEGTTHHAAGSVLTQVNSSLDGATVVIN